MAMGRGRIEGEWPEKVYVYSEGNYHAVYSTPGPPKALRTKEMNDRKNYKEWYGEENTDPEPKVFECEVIKVKEI